MAFATYNDVESRWRTLTADERTKATTLLGDAAAILSARVRVDDRNVNQSEVLKIVSCNMVIRSMVASESQGIGIDKLTATMGPFAQSAEFANPNGDLYLTKMEKLALGIGGRGRGRILSPYNEPCHVLSPYELHELCAECGV